MKMKEAYQKVSEFGEAAAFVGNLILTQHSKSVSKLKGLLGLLKKGHEVRTAQFSTDILIIDGKKFGWEVLDSPAVIKSRIQDKG